MAHGKNAERHNGKEWWGKRPLSGLSTGMRTQKWWKRLLHKIERKMGKKEISERTVI